MKKRFHFNLKSKHLLFIMTFICIGLLLISFSSSKAARPLKIGSGYVVTPFQKGINNVGSWFSDKLSGFRSVQALNKENQELQAQIDALKEENNKLIQKQSELERLEALFALDKEYPDYNKVAAQVISKDPGNWFSTFIIDKGTEDGLAVDMNVIAQGGLIGIITDIGPGWAEVRSIIDDESNVSGMAANTSESCIVSGSLSQISSGTISFSGLRDNTDAVKEGTSIVTSNISNKYLTGILIGYVSEISQDYNKLTKSGKIIPAANFRALREVLVITDLKETKE